MALQALDILQQAVQTAHGALTNKLALSQALMAAIKALEIDFGEVKAALATYESMVTAVAKGNAAVINNAGLLSRTPKGPPEPLGKVTQVMSMPGKYPGEATITWPRGPGATCYGIEVNYTPQNPDGPWTALVSGTRRRRVVKGLSPGAQFLVRVASLGSGGTQADWSDPILATAL